MTLFAAIYWLNASRTNTGLKLPHTDKAEPALTMSDQARWEAVELLLNDDTISHHSRVAGLFMLLFSWPLNEILTIASDYFAVSSAVNQGLPLRLKEPRPSGSIQNSRNSR